MKFSTLLPLMAFSVTATAAPIPGFHLHGSDGKTYTAARLATGKPTILMFFSAACPHNKGGIEDMNKLVGLLRGQIRIIGMTNLDPSQTRQFARKYAARFPILSDKSMHVIEAFGAKAGLDTALITPRGQLTESWTGYNRGTLKKLFRDVTEKGGPAVHVNLDSFPKDRQSGCIFMSM